MVVPTERVAVERELGSGQGDIMTTIPNSNHTRSSGIGSDVVLTQVISKHTQNCCFYTQAPDSGVLGCKH